MSERAKLEEEFLYKRGRTTTISDFIIAWGKLVENCKHEKTHWIQEVDSMGNFHNDLVKRCYVCGVNIDTLEDVEKEFVEKLLANFDKSCEKKKASINQKETVKP
jgi:hypothetical protein